MIQFELAKKEQGKLRMALYGISGSGKTMSALKIAKYLGKKILVLDTERGSASKYAGEKDIPEFYTIQLRDSHAPVEYISVINEAVNQGFDVIIIDSLSHAWIGKEGLLEQVDSISSRSRSGNSYYAWRNVTPQHTALIDAIVGADAHVIATMRSKTSYEVETNEFGKSVPRKVGKEPVQREGLEYEFDVVCSMDLDHNLIVEKSRCSELQDKKINRPGKEVAESLNRWLGSGDAHVEHVVKVPEPLEFEPELAKPAEAPVPVDVDASSPEFAQILLQINAAESLAELQALHPLIVEHKAVNQEEAKTLQKRYTALKKTFQ